MTTTKIETTIAMRMFNDAIETLDWATLMQWDRLSLMQILAKLSEGGHAFTAEHLVGLATDAGIFENDDNP